MWFIHTMEYYSAVNKIKKYYANFQGREAIIVLPSCDVYGWKWWPEWEDIC